MIDKPPLPDAPVEVNQADREAAALTKSSDGWHPDIAKRYRAGLRDHSPLVQAFARHRLRTEALTGSAEVERPADEDLDPYLPDSLRAAKRCGVQRSAWLDGWFVPWSPRNENENAEGPWSDWVALAHAILAADAKARAALTTPNQDASA